MVHVLDRANRLSQITGLKCQGSLIQTHTFDFTKFGQKLVKNKWCVSFFLECTLNKGWLFNVHDSKKVNIQVCTRPVISQRPQRFALVPFTNDPS